MTLKSQNTLLLLAAAALLAWPLLTVSLPEDGEEFFAGADGQAEKIISELAPGYQPWAAPLVEPASGEIESLLFALQAALGAGFLGYYLGRQHGRRSAAQASGAGC